MATWGRCDFKQLKDFQERIKKLEGTDFDAFCDSCAKELAARLLAKVIKRTPVGKKPKIQGPKTEKVTGARGKSRSFLTAEGARLDQYWGGYMGGTLQRGWTAKTEAEASSGGKSDAKAYVNALPITKSGNMIQIEIINPVHYASYVEYGHRQRPGRFVPAICKRLKDGWVKGKFMLTISEQELDSQAPSILENKLKKYLGECFNG